MTPMSILRFFSSGFEMNEYDKVGFVLSADISCAAGLLLFTTFVAQFGKCPSFSAHLRLQPGCRGEFCAQGELLSPAEQSHMNKAWSEETLTPVPLQMLCTY